MRRRKTWAMLVALASGLAALLAVEAGLRLFAPVGAFVLTNEWFRPSLNPALIYELKPGVSEHNADGFRGLLVSPEKPPGVFRILVVGDSVTYGLGVGYEDTWVRGLARLCGENAPPGTRFEVLNLGVPGYGMGQIVERLRTKGLFYRPDLIVYGYWLDDVTDSFSRIQKAFAEARDEVAFSDSDMEKGLVRLAAGFQIARRLILLYKRLSEKARERELPKGAGGLDPGVKALVASLVEPNQRVLAAGAREPYFQYYRDPANLAPWVENMRELSHIQASTGAPVVLALCPVVEGHRPGPYRYGALNEFVARTARMYGLSCLDLGDAFAGLTEEEILGPDSEHPNEAGHATIARALYPLLLPWLPKGGP